MSRYKHCYIYVGTSRKPVTDIIARCIERNENYVLYKESFGPWHFCAAPNEVSDSKHPSLVGIYCECWLKDHSRTSLLTKVAGKWGVPPETETMHRMTGYDA
jgi:hypothetical protein